MDVVVKPGGSLTSSNVICGEISESHDIFRFVLSEFEAPRRGQTVCFLVSSYLLTYKGDVAGSLDIGLLRIHIVQLRMHIGGRIIEKSNYYIAI